MIIHFSLFKSSLHDFHANSLWVYTSTYSGPFNGSAWSIFLLSEKLAGAAKIANFQGTCHEQIKNICSDWKQKHWEKWPMLMTFFLTTIFAITGMVLYLGHQCDFEAGTERYKTADKKWIKVNDEKKFWVYRHTENGSLHRWDSNKALLQTSFWPAGLLQP